MIKLLTASSRVSDDPGTPCLGRSVMVEHPNKQKAKDMCQDYGLQDACPGIGDGPKTDDVRDGNKISRNVKVLFYL